MSINKRIVPALALTILLAACGGGDTSDVATASSTQLSPTAFTSEGRPINTCSLIPACSGVTTAPFISSVLMGGARERRNAERRRAN